MAARKKIFQDENTRAKIQTTQIIKRLQKHIDAKPEIVDGVVITNELMTQSQVTAALGLIKKTLPDLTAIEHSGEIDTGDASSLTEQQIINRLDQLARDRTSDGATEPKEGAEITH